MFYPFFQLTSESSKRTSGLNLDECSGLKPNPPGSWSDYSIPTVRFPDGSYLMDSAAIATELEARYPTPSLRLDPRLEKEAQDAIAEVFMRLVPYMLPYAPNMVAPEDVEWFKADRARRFGTTVEEAFDVEKDAAPYLAAAGPGFEKCAKVLQEHKVDQGPFILGSEPCYADFYLASTMQMFSRSGERTFAGFLEASPPEMRKLYEACQKWTTKQD